MKRLIACFLAGLLLAGTSVHAQAQAVAGTESALPARVVIAPPASDLARTIKAELFAQYYGAPKNSRTYDEAQKLYYFYGERHFEPIWLNKSASGDLQYSEAAQKIMAVFQNAEAEGLRPSDYLTPDIDITSAGTDTQKLAAVETAFSAAAARYAQHAFAGRIDPRQVSGDIDITPRQIDASAMLIKLAGSEDPGKILLDLSPKHPEFLRLKAALAKFDGTAERPVAIPEGRSLKPGMLDERVPLLRARLDLPAVPGSTEYDADLVAAVTKFQESLGLEADGVAGPATVAALNGDLATSREDILANMERWRWMPEDLGTFNVLVNIPEFRLYVADQGNVTYTTRVVVGTPQHKTVLFSDNIRHIVMNPYWNVPSSIAKSEIAPKALANPGYIDSQNMELLYKGQVVSPWQVNWSAVPPGSFPFSVRQKPGAGNALGMVKFLFPNSHDIYLHDTPSKSLFSRAMRAYSHGCVRVQNPMEFANALLQHEPDLTATALEAMSGPKERWVNLKTHVPVHLAYFTLRIDEDGTIRSYGDVYGYNKALIEMMNQ